MTKRGDSLQKNFKNIVKTAIFGDMLSILLAALAVVFVVYYIAVGFFAGFGMSILYIWPFFSGCIILYLTLRALVKLGVLPIPKWAIVTFYILFFVCLAFFLSVEACIFSGFFSQAPDGLDYVIVLGAKVNGKTPSLALKMRIDDAYNYLADNQETVCIASGGQGADEGISEAECIARELVARGIDADRIIIEDRSTSTSENLKYTADLVGDKTKSVAVVTNNFHVFRSMALARRCGLQNISGISADMPTILLPHYLVREFISLFVDTARGNTKF